MINKFISTIKVFDGLGYGNAMLFTRHNLQGVQSMRFYTPTLTSVRRFNRLIVTKVIKILTISPVTGELVFVSDPMYGFVPVALLHRNDIHGTDYDASKITDDDIQTLADKMGNSYTSGSYWDDLNYHLENLDLPTLEESDSE